MAWTTPRTAQTGEQWTSADFNTYIKNNLLETMPGKASAALQYFVSTDLNAITTRAASSATAAGPHGTTSGTYVALTGDPAVTVTTGKRALVFFTAGMSNSSSSTQCHVSVAVSGATTIAASDTWAASVDGVLASELNRFGMFHLFTTLTAGSNTFTMQYKTGTAGTTTATFTDRHIIVVPF